MLGFVGERLDNNKFLGPITLKTALCLTPPILLLLVNTASDSNENRETVNLAFLIIRLVIVCKYNQDESIFVAKNVITIILSVKEIFDLHRPVQRLDPAHQQPQNSTMLS